MLGGSLRVSRELEGEGEEQGRLAREHEQVHYERVLELRVDESLLLTASG